MKPEIDHRNIQRESVSTGRLFVFFNLLAEVSFCDGVVTVKDG